MKKKFLLWLVLCTATLNLGAESSEKSPYVSRYNLPKYEFNLAKPWVIYFAEEAPSQCFDPYDPIVLDSDYHPPIAPMVKRGKKVFGTVSLGEICSYRSYFEDAEEDGLILSENPLYPGSFYVDIRNPLWKTLLIKEIIPNVLNQGFNGLLLETLDIPLFLEEKNEGKYAGMKEAAIDLVKCIREAFPNTDLMISRAYSLLPSVGNYINIALGDGLYTHYNVKAKSYEKVCKQTYHLQKRALRKAQSHFPHLTALSLDYWDPSDKEMIKKIYRKERQNRFRPYVTTIEMNKIIPELKE